MHTLLQTRNTGNKHFASSEVKERGPRAEHANRGSADVLVTANGPLRLVTKREVKPHI